MIQCGFQDHGSMEHGPYVRQTNSDGDKRFTLGKCDILECHYYFKWPDSQFDEYYIINGEEENKYVGRDIVLNIQNIH